MTISYLAAAMVVAYAATAIARPVPPSGDRSTEALKSSTRHGEWIEIPLDDAAKTKLHTWVSYPERADKAPVILVIHEIFGMTDWVRSTADALAADGFVAIAPDMLSGLGPNGGNTESFKGDEVRAAIQKLSADDVAKRLDAMRAYVKTLPSVTERFGVIGFCWGGGQSFQYAMRQPTLGAVVVYYGTGPTTAADATRVSAPVLGHYGGDDARVTATVEVTRKAMADAGKSFEPIVYQGAGHGFLRQQDGKSGANAKAAEAAWTRTIAFLKEKLS